MGVAQEQIDLDGRVDQVRNEAAQRRKGGSVAIAQAGLVQPVDEVARPLRHRAEKEHDVRRGHLLFEFHLDQA